MDRSSLHPKSSNYTIEARIQRIQALHNQLQRLNQTIRLHHSIGQRQWRVGYIDQNGKWIIKPQFNTALYFKDGPARVQIGNKWGYINKQGNIIWPS